MSSVCQQFLGKKGSLFMTKDHGLTTACDNIIIGSRIQHQWQKEINTLSDFCYYGLTTLLGTKKTQTQHQAMDD